MADQATEPTAEQIISLIEGIARDPVLKPPYRQHAAELASVMRGLPMLVTGTDVILLLLGWNKGQSEGHDA